MQIHAIYENGVLKPLEPLNIKEHEEVEIVVKGKNSAARMSQGIVQGDNILIEEVALSPLYDPLEGQ
jgi:predicted DNA-binding antitoxin AbrB/MazE fold protein